MNKYAYLFSAFLILCGCELSPKEKTIDDLSQIQVKEKIIEDKSKISEKEKNLYLDSLNSETKLVQGSPKYKEVLKDNILQYKIINRADLRSVAGLSQKPKKSKPLTGLNYKKKDGRVYISYLFYQSGQDEFIPYVKVADSKIINIDFYTVFDVHLYKENGKIQHAPLADAISTMFELKISIPISYSKGRKILFKGIELKKHTRCKECQEIKEH
jgi:hypothetical protein